MRNVIIMGAAGRDFHNFNVRYRDDPEARVVAFTATQIPNIDDRRYPATLAGPQYPEGIPIEPESELTRLVEELRVDDVVFAYSDVSYAYLGQRASIAAAAGASFVLLGPQDTWLESHKPVVAVCAVRTGAGKSPTTRRIAALLRDAGKRVAVVRHPMPYGKLAAQAVERFETYEDLDRYDCTIEEREEYEPHLDAGTLVFAGVDYEKILRQAESDADIILWDGGNNDFSFYRADLYITIADPHRPGHEVGYWPGEVNLRLADVVVIGKVDTADPGGVAEVRSNIVAANPAARIVEAAMPVRVDDPEQIRGQRVLVVEDGPTITHGGMESGAGFIAARRDGAAEVIDPRPFLQGSLVDTFRRYPHIGPVLPAMGYGEEQVRDLEATIAASGADRVIIGTPVDLRRVMRIDAPACRVRYDIDVTAGPPLEEILAPFL